jgi:hypothetical protein
MTAHLRATCGSVEILVPARRVSGIANWAGPLRPLPPTRRMPRGEPVLDARRLFPGQKLSPGSVAIAWRSPDGTLTATILVDRAAWYDGAAALATATLPRLPALAAGLFDAAVADGDAILLRLREDAGVGPGGRALLRRLRRAAVDLGGT